MKNLKCILICSLLATASLQAAACFTVYDRVNQVVYNASMPPVDMSLPIHQTLPQVYPGGHLVMSLDNKCPREQSAPVAAQTSTGTAPLLTDPRTAAAMHVPHTILASGAALVQPNESNRSMMPAPLVMSAAVAVLAVKSRNDTVITEMHNPPLMGVEAAGGLTITELH